MPTHAHIPEWYTYKRELPYGPQCFPVLARAFASLVFRLRVPRVAPPSNPLLQLTFCGTRLRSTGHSVCIFHLCPIVSALAMGLACPKGDYAWRNMTWQLLAAGPAGLSRRIAPADSGCKASSPDNNRFLWGPARS